jgi:hypothetical protein
MTALPLEKNCIQYLYAYMGTKLGLVLGVFENRVLRRIFGCKTEDVTTEDVA